MPERQLPRLKLGNYLRLRYVLPDALPPHPRMEDIQKKSNTPTLLGFIDQVVDEALYFAGCVPGAFRYRGKKKSAPAATDIDLYSREILAPELSKCTPQDWKSDFNRNQCNFPFPEKWVARCSTHRDKAERGTMSRDEFDAYIRVLHSHHEKDYTPDVYDAYRILDWEPQIREIDLPDRIRFADLSMYEMCHKLPFPLKPRVFPVVVLTALMSDLSIIVAQIPMQLATMKRLAFYSTGRNSRELDVQDPLRRKPAVEGIYTSVEYITRDVHRNECTWTMATASDARGNLPLWIQAPGVEKAIVKDVGLFTEYCHQKRLQRSPRRSAFTESEMVNPLVVPFQPLRVTIPTVPGGPVVEGQYQVNEYEERRMLGLFNESVRRLNEHNRASANSGRPTYTQAVNASDVNSAAHTAPEAAAQIPADAATQTTTDAATQIAPEAADPTNSSSDTQTGSNDEPRRSTARTSEGTNLLASRPPSRTSDGPEETAQGGSGEAGGVLPEGSAQNDRSSIGNGQQSARETATTEVVTT